jgi:NAD-dependent dihydropyrimidine dehydrogenase PreA subunit
VAAIVDVQKCTGCGDCIESCPTESIKLENEKAVINDDCIECGACVDECPNETISLPE